MPRLKIGTGYLRIGSGYLSIGSGLVPFPGGDPGDLSNLTPADFGMLLIQGDTEPSAVGHGITLTECGSGNVGKWSGAPDQFIKAYVYQADFPGSTASIEYINTDNVLMNHVFRVPDGISNIEVESQYASDSVGPVGPGSAEHDMSCEVAVSPGVGRKTLSFIYTDKTNSNQINTPEHTIWNGFDNHDNGVFGPDRDTDGAGSISADYQENEFFDNFVFAVYALAVRVHIVS